MSEFLTKVVKTEPGWYRGDFHAHTNFSDGYYEPLDLIDAARTAGLDFLSITDHNTLDAFTSFDPPEDLLIVPGMEVTLKEGHYNVLGVEAYAGWMDCILTNSPRATTLQGREETISQLMAHAADQGILNSINHPRLVPWAWLDETTDLRCLHCLEIFNDPSFSDNAQANPQAIALWTEWLNAGYRITAIGGTDYHQPQFKPGYDRPQQLGIPSTYVYAEQLSGKAIITGLRQLKAYVSLGPQVSFQAQANGQLYDIGADVGPGESTIEFAAGISDSHTASVAQLLKNGAVIVEATLVDGQGTLHAIDKTSLSQAAWYRLDVLGQFAEILAVTNPIFTGPRPDPEPRTFGAL